MSRDQKQDSVAPVVASVVCTACGVLEIAVTDLTVVSSMDTELLIGYRCPSCDEWVEQPIDAKIRTWLLAGGASLGLAPTDEIVRSHEQT